MDLKDTVLSLKNITKSYTQGKQDLHIINKSFLNIYKGELVSLVGPSGSGKTTLLQVAGLLDNPTSGDIYINSINATKCNEKEQTKLRRDNLGFVYQFHHLLPEFDALENVAMPLLIKGVNKNEAYKEAQNILERVNLADRLKHRPSELSGGEQQRVAIARAIVSKPSLILADEPTGNLDPDTSNIVFELLLSIIKENNLAALIVTHNRELAKRTDRVVTIKDGFLIDEKEAEEGGE